MVRKLTFLCSFITLFALTPLVAQVDSNLVQFSGMILDGTTQELVPVPYVNILVKDKGRGSYSDFNGFFSIVVEKGDQIVFSAVGYRTVEYTIPD
ncbi:MAG: carboxypeptidase-like regulatory domain-containing protein, partial [Bacteroidota bacterium]